MPNVFKIEFNLKGGKVQQTLKCRSFISKEEVIAGLNADRLITSLGRGQDNGGGPAVEDLSSGIAVADILDQVVGPNISVDLDQDPHIVTDFVELNN